MARKTEITEEVFVCCRCGAEHEVTRNKNISIAQFVRRAPECCTDEYSEPGEEDHAVWSESGQTAGIDLEWWDIDPETHDTMEL